MEGSWRYICSNPGNGPGSLCLLVIGSRIYWHKLRIPYDFGGWEIIGGVAPKRTPVHHGAQNDTAISSVVHHVGQEGKVVNRSNHGSPSSWRCWSIISRDIDVKW